jgi:hypothetical protein
MRAFDQNMGDGGLGGAIPAHGRGGAIRAAVVGHDDLMINSFPAKHLRQRRESCLDCALLIPRRDDDRELHA